MAFTLTTELMQEMRVLAGLEERPIERGRVRARQHAERTREERNSILARILEKEQAATQTRQKSQTVRRLQEVAKRRELHKRSKRELIAENLGLRREIKEKDRTIQRLQRTRTWEDSLSRQRPVQEEYPHQVRRNRPRRAPEPPPPPRAPGLVDDRELIAQIEQADPTAHSGRAGRAATGPLPQDLGDTASPAAPAPVLAGPTPGDLVEKTTRWEGMDYDPFGAPLPSSDPEPLARFQEPEVLEAPPAPLTREPQPSARFETIGSDIMRRINEADPLEG